MSTSTSTVTMVQEPNQVQWASRQDKVPEKHLTIDGLLKSHASEAQDPVLVGYPVQGVTDFEEYTAKTLDAYTDAAVAKYISSGLEPADPALENAPVVAVLAPSSLEIVITIFALNRLGWSALFLSTRLSAPAYARLLEMAQCTKIITTEAYKHVIDDMRKEIECQSIPILERKDYRNIKAERFHRNCDPIKESKKIAWIIHSSGSTGFPKPIFLSNKVCIANFKKGFSLRAFCTSPLFHSHGLMELFRAIYWKRPMYLGNYSFPVTRQNLIDAMRAARPELMCAVPYVLKLLAETDDGIGELTKTKLVLFAGSSCPDDVGNQLVAKGVNLVANYGATETGVVMTSFRPPGDTEWSYLRLQYPVAEHILMDEISTGVFECVALDGLPSKGPSNSSNPPNSFRTRDLFTRHPDPNKANFWKYLSRLDDRLTLVNGEKVLPIPIEGRIRQDELVKEAAVFGVGRTVSGVLVFRSERASSLTDEEYLNAIWPAIESANSNAETFSQISQDLVVVLPSDTTYPRTDKGTFIRQQLYHEFATVIDAAYENFENGRAGSLQLDVPGLETFLMQKFSTEFDIHLESTESDIFAAGVDSLQTTRMWRIIKQELDLGGNGGALSQNIVFEKGNVKSLARHLYFLRTGQEEEESDELVFMEELIEKYSVFEPHTGGDAINSGKNVVLLTGATGTLGTYLLAELLKLDHVSQVWTLVRASDPPTALSRVLNSLSSRDFQLSELNTAKIIALPSDFSLPNLGLSKINLQNLTSSLTHVIHSAWAVNFNLGVRSFEAQHIRGTYNLLNLCLRTRHSAPAKFFFCSSVSAASGTPKPAIIAETAVEDLRHAQKMGYGRSKLVTEHIVRNAMRSTGMHARVFRIGQVAGDSVTGNWNETEAVSLMIRSALTTGALPALDESPSWLPVDICARIILGLTFLSAPSTDPAALNRAQDPNLVYHILNPRTFHWTRDLLPALRHTTLPPFETVSPSAWLAKLKNSNPDPIKNPSVKLIDFWEGKYGAAEKDDGKVDMEDGKEKGEGKGVKAVSAVDEDTKGLFFETKQTVRDSPILGGAPDIVGDGHVERFVRSWMEKWRS